MSSGRHRDHDDKVERLKQALIQRIRDASPEHLYQLAQSVERLDEVLKDLRLPRREHSVIQVILNNIRSLLSGSS